MEDTPSRLGQSGSPPRLRFPRDFGLTLVLLGTLAALAVIQTWVGHAVYNADQETFSLPPISYREYFSTGLCWESLAENWESEFLEMAAFVWLTSFLYQRGSPASHDPDGSIAGGSGPCTHTH